MDCKSHSGSWTMGGGLISLVRYVLGSHRGVVDVKRGG